MSQVQADVHSKSQIAIEYCYRYREKYPLNHVFWVYASTAARFGQAFEEIGQRIPIPNWKYPTLDTVKVVSRWLDNADEVHWLMVVDNADDMELFFGSETTLQEEKIHCLAQYLPQPVNGNILFTTRYSRMVDRIANRSKPLMVDRMSLEDATSLLLSKLPDDISSQVGSAELVKELEFLPLAITQAAAFMNENFVGPVEYLKALRMTENDYKDFLDQSLEDPRRDPSSDSSVMKTWRLSFQQIRKEKPDAFAILALMSVLDRQRVPKFLLRTPTIKEIDFLTAIGTLKGFSFISTQRGGDALEMHRLVQMATQMWLEWSDLLSTWQLKAFRLVSKSFSYGTYKDRSYCEDLVPHAEVVLTYDAVTEQDLLCRAELLQAITWYELTQRDQYALGYARCSEAFSIYQRFLMEGDFRLLECYLFLGNILMGQGKVIEAVKTLKEALTSTTEEYYAGSIMQNLANILLEDVKLEEAAGYAVMAWELHERLCGPKHPMTAKDILTLANVKQTQRKYEEASTLYRRVLTFKE